MSSVRLESSEGVQEQHKLTITKHFSYPNPNFKLLACYLLHKYLQYHL